MDAWSAQTQALIAAAIAEDLGAAGDITSALLPGPTEIVSARLMVREAGVVCGLALASDICAAYSERLGANVSFLQADGEGGAISDGFKATGVTAIGTLAGARAAVLATERTLLNFLGRMSGVASLTKSFVDAARATNPQVQVLDTRKTLPGWRELDRYAVRTGGGVNHRWGLSDAVLLKDNHLAGIPVEELAAVLTRMLSQLATRPAFVEVEVDSLEQFDQVAQVDGIDMILLDNFGREQLREAVARREKRARSRPLLLEASGGVTLETIGPIAATGVDRISCGALTHSAVSLNLALDF